MGWLQMTMWGSYGWEQSWPIVSMLVQHVWKDWEKLEICNLESMVYWQHPDQVTYK
jgi:hypothetical protein